MKHLRLFQREIDYQRDKDNLDTPSISYINYSDEIRLQKDNYILATYFIEPKYDGEGNERLSELQLFGVDFNLNQVSKIYVDGEELEITNKKNVYGGTHEVKISFKNLTSCYDMFHNCEHLTKLNLLNFNTVNVTNMGKMFTKCGNLTTIENLNCLNTLNVTNMSSMFSGCTSLTHLDLSNFITNQVTNMSNMFYNCTGLTSISGISNWETPNVTNMSSMFSGCTSLTYLDLSNFITNQVTNMSNMFFGCSNLYYIYLDKFDTSKVTDMNLIFGNCGNLSEIYMYGPTNSEANFEQLFNDTYCEWGYFSYCSEYDYSRILAAIPSNWGTETICP